MRDGDALKEALCEHLSARPNIALTMSIAHEAIDDAPTLHALLQLVYTAEDPLRWRAAWALTKVAEQCPSLLVAQRDRLASLAIHTDVSQGLMRLLLAVLYSLPDTEEIDVALLNCLLDTMVCLQAPPGVQALAMKLAFRICSADDDLRGEFLCIVQSMELDFYSPGVRAAARQCLKKKDKKK